MTDPSATPLGSSPTGPATPGTPAGQAAGAAAVPPQIGSAAAAAAAAAAAQFPGKAADAVQLLVDTLHDKAVRPAHLAARAVVFGLIVAAMTAVFLVVGAVAAVRLLDDYAFGHQVWASYLLIGGLLALAGLGAWTRRSAAPSPVRPD